MESAADEAFSKPATESNLELANPDNPGQPSRGYIYSNQIGPNGRPIAFVYSGETDTEDGTDIFLSADDIMQSINVQQLYRGHAYPLFYDTLFDDLRQRMREVSLEAKSGGTGLWPSDKTNDAVAWPGTLADLPPIFPKLWRRIQEFRRDETLFDSDRPFANFKEWIEIEKEERVAIPSQDLFTGFDDLVETTEDTVKMTIDPHDMVIVSA